jgi:hypothetical protein
MSFCVIGKGNMIIFRGWYIWTKMCKSRHFKVVQLIGLVYKKIILTWKKFH